MQISNCKHSELHLQQRGNSLFPRCGVYVVAFFVTFLLNTERLIRAAAEDGNTVPFVC